MIELGNLAPLRSLVASIEEWESQVRRRPLPDEDPVVQTLATVRQQLAQAVEEAAHVEMELTAEQYATLTGLTRDAIYKRWQRGKLPEARMRGGKLAFPLSAVMRDAAA